LNPSNFIITNANFRIASDQSAQENDAGTTPKFYISDKQGTS
jgi:hypothetical protein